MASRFVLERRIGGDTFSAAIETSNNLIQKRLAFRRERSGAVSAPGAGRVSGSCPAGCMAEAGLWWWGNSAAAIATGDPDGKTYGYEAYYFVGGFAARGSRS